MPPKITSRLSILLLALLGSFAGCAKDERKPVFPVAGRVVYQGKATPGALVVFHPRNDADTFQVKPHAVVGPDGRFEVGMYERGGGMPVGQYTITIKWNKPSSNPDMEGPSLLPKRYAHPETSGLSAEIREDTKELPPFELEP